MTATLTERQQAAQVAATHPGWIVWTDRPVATRASGNHQWPAPRGYEETIVADDWTQLDEALTAQDDNDKARAK